VLGLCCADQLNSRDFADGNALAEIEEHLDAVKLIIDPQSFPRISFPHEAAHSGAQTQSLFELFAGLARCAVRRDDTLPKPSRHHT
jgi:hypothetical protein